MNEPSSFLTIGGSFGRDRVLNSITKIKQRLLQTMPNVHGSCSLVGWWVVPLRLVLVKNVSGGCLKSGRGFNS